MSGLSYAPPADLSTGTALANNPLTTSYMAAQVCPAARKARQYSLPSSSPSPSHSSSHRPQNSGGAQPPGICLRMPGDVLLDGDACALPSLASIPQLVLHTLPLSSSSSPSHWWSGGPRGHAPDRTGVMGANAHGQRTALFLCCEGRATRRCPFSPRSVCWERRRLEVDSRAFALRARAALDLALTSQASPFRTPSILESIHAASAPPPMPPPPPPPPSQPPAPLMWATVVGPPAPKVAIALERGGLGRSPGSCLVLQPLRIHTRT